MREKRGQRWKPERGTNYSQTAREREESFGCLDHEKSLGALAAKSADREKTSRGARGKKVCPQIGVNSSEEEWNIAGRRASLHSFQGRENEAKMKRVAGQRAHGIAFSEHFS